MYTITLDPNGGSLSETSINVQYNHVYSLPEPIREGYTFGGWYDVSNKIGDGGTWRFASNKTLVARWSAIKYSITYELNGGTNAANNPSTYTIESEYTLSAPTKTGYTFEGWYKEDAKITSIPLGSTGNIKVEARWTVILYKLSVTSEDDSKGTVSISSGSGYTGESITVTASATGDYVFGGWYHESVKVSNATTYTFTMPANDYSIVARFLTKAEEERLEKRGAIPVLSDDGKTITYGLYPQANINDQATIDELNKLTTPDSNGWYLYNDEYYAKLDAHPCSSKYVFDNGTKIVEDETYWFKCESITWNVLNGENGEYFVLSSVLLDEHCYDGHYTYPFSDNNYKDSDIRAWLNNEFYNSAFALDNGYIQTTTVDNSAATTDSPKKNDYACENTEDKVFLPSYQDYNNVDYGFASDESRKCKTTDYARANGADYSTDSSYLYGGAYWTRSPDSSDVIDARCVGYGGNLNFVSSVNVDHFGVRPCLVIKLAQFVKLSDSQKLDRLNKNEQEMKTWLINEKKNATQFFLLIPNRPSPMSPIDKDAIMMTS